MSVTTKNMRIVPKPSFLFLLVFVLIVSGCWYPKVSPKAFALAKATYNACSIKSESQLDKVEELKNKFLESEEINQREADYFQGFIDQARAGEWKEAAAETRQLMEDQVTKN